LPLALPLRANYLPQHVILKLRSHKGI
jgi:hypothetical protein